MDKKPWEAYAQPSAGAEASKPWEAFGGETAKPKTPGVFGTLKEGAKSTGRALASAADSYSPGDGQRVVDRARAQQDAPKAEKLDKFYSDIESGRGEDDGLGDALRNVGGAVVRNPGGAGLAVVEQLPNAAPALGGGWLGMKAGAAGGAALGSAVPGVGTAIGGIAGGVLGGLAGMFLGNAAIETGHKAMEMANDGDFTPEEASQARSEGAIKGGVITGVDAITLGLGRLATSGLQRTVTGAMEGATRKTLVDRGIDIADEVAVARAVANPEVASAVRTAQLNAIKTTDSLRKRVGEGATLLAMESVGEGIGEYLGELAATGEADITEAVLESVLSLGQSGIETAWNVRGAREAAQNKVQPLPTDENPNPAPVERPDPAGGALSRAAAQLPSPEPVLGLPAPDPVMYADSDGVVQDTGPVVNVDGVMQPAPQARPAEIAGDRTMVGMEGQAPAGIQPNTIPAEEQRRIDRLGQPQIEQERADLIAAAHVNNANAQIAEAMAERESLGEPEPSYPAPKGLELADKDGHGRWQTDMYRESVQALVGQLTKGGDIAYVRDANDRIVSRTASVNPSWWQNMDASVKPGSIEQAKRIVSKALVGGNLGPKQARFIRAMMDLTDDMRVDPQQVELDRATLAELERASAARNQQDYAQGEARGGVIDEQDAAELHAYLTGQAEPFRLSDLTPADYDAVYAEVIALDDTAEQTAEAAAIGDTETDFQGVVYGNNQGAGQAGSEVPAQQGLPGRGREAGQDGPAVPAGGQAGPGSIEGGNEQGLAPPARAAVEPVPVAPAQQVTAEQQPPVPSLEGRDIDGDWAEFSAESGTLGIPRSEMPQIKAEHRGAMVQFMAARDIARQEEIVPASSLKPTQAEYSRKKVGKAQAFTGGNRSILVSADGHVLDGHHQWMAAREAGDDVKIIRLDAPIDELLPLAHEFPSSTTDEGAAPASQSDAAESGAAAFSRASATVTTLNRGDVEKITARLVTEATMARRFVFASWEQLPKAIKDTAAAQGARPSDVKAVHWRGKTYLVDRRFADARDVERTIYHEYFAHYGLRQRYGKGLEKQMNRMLLRLGGVRGLQAMAESQGFNIDHYIEGTAQDASLTASQRGALLMDELLAHMAEATGTLKRALQEWYGIVRNWLRENGWAEMAKLNAADLAYELRLARQFALAADASEAGDGPMFHRADQTETPEFSRWFGDSKVVDAQGNPLVVYHGSSERFTEFDPKKAGMGNDRGMRGRGLYFSPNERTAASYGENVMPVYLSIKTPFIPTDFESKAEIAERLGVDESIFEYSPGAEFRVLQSFSGTLTSALKDAGYDGVIYPQRQEFIAFSPEQVKSAIGNRGTFDPDSADIRFSFAGEGAATADQESLAKAQELARGGAPNSTLQRVTGWHVGQDGKWRFEISDDSASLRIEPGDVPRMGELQDRFAREMFGVDYAQLPAFADAGDRSRAINAARLYLHNYQKLENVLWHPQLLAAYPQLGGIQVEFKQMKEGSMGAYSHRGNRIEISSALTRDQALSTLLHEVQHAIQAKEGWARGGSVNKNFTDSVRSHVSSLANDADRDLQRWQWDNRHALAEEKQASELLRNALKYESVERLMSYANRDSPSGVFRLIRNELQWIHGEDLQRNPETREIDGLFYAIPKRGAQRNERIRDIAYRSAQLIRDSIPADTLRSLRQDERATKSVVAALRRQASRTSKQVQGLRTLEARRRQAEQLNEVTRFKSPYSIYRALAGEVEARATQARQGLTEEERRNRPVAMDRDVPAEEVIVVYHGGEVALPSTMLSAAAPASDIRFRLVDRILRTKAAATADAFSDLNADQKNLLRKVGTPPTVVQAKDWLKARMERAGTKIRQGIVDRYAALKELDEKLHGKDFIENSIHSSSWVLARMSSAASGAMQAMMTTGRLSFDVKEKTITLRDGANTGGLTGLLAQLGSPAEVERWFGWIAANRAEKLANEWVVKVGSKETRYGSEAEARAATAKISGARAKASSRENLFTADEIAAGKALNTGRTESGESRAMLYGKVFREFQQYRDDVLAIAEQTGIISAENRAMWRDEFYVPFYRVMEEDAASGSRTGKGLSRQEAYKKLKGGTQNLNDLLENTLMNFHHLLSASLKNQAAAQVMTNAQAAGIARRVPESGRDTKTTTFILRDGRKEFYQIDDGLVFEALTALADPGLNNMAVQVMSSFKRVFTNMTTVTPQFILANTMRDLMQAAATSPTSKNVLGNLVQGVKGYRDATTRAEMLASGGAFSFGHLYGADANEVRASLKRTVRGAQLITDPSMAPNLLRAVWRKWGDVADTAENTARAAIYQQNVEQHGRLRAAYEARDVMDFSQHGAFPAVRFLIRVVPFLNARLQGLDKLYRSGFKPALLTAMGKGTASDKQAALRFGAVTGALTLASIALYLANADDDEYRKLEDWQKDTYWAIRVGSNMFFIPKPFEVGAIATMAERLTEQMVDDKATGKLFAERLQNMLMETFSFSPVPHAFQPVLDVYANEDAFTGRDIETMGMERLSKGLRSRDNTTAAAHAVSAVSRVLGDDTPVALSPVQADHLIRGYLGAVGANAAGMIDTVWRTANGQEAPDKRWSERQPMRRFYRDLDVPMPYNRYSTLFYEGLRESSRVYADVMELQQLGRHDEARALQQEKRSTLAMRQMLNQQQRRISTINKQIEAVRRSDRDGAWKRREIDRLNLMRGQITERMGKRVEEVRASS